MKRLRRTAATAFTAQRGSSSPSDLLFQTVDGYCVVGSANTGGGALRVSRTGSSQNCDGGGPAPTARYEAENATYSAGSSVDSDHTGYSGTGCANGAPDIDYPDGPA
ncbi:hypothetical protein ACWDZ6_07145 [Streptomyces sp. NPDC002926]